MKKQERYPGIDNEVNGGMTAIGRIIRDAWVFGIIPETETCEGWNFAGIDDLSGKVNAEWDKYGCLVGNLPDELRARHDRIHSTALAQARNAGWSGERETEGEN